MTKVAGLHLYTTHRSNHLGAFLELSSRMEENCEVESSDAHKSEWLQCLLQVHEDTQPYNLMPLLKSDMKEGCQEAGKL